MPARARQLTLRDVIEDPGLLRILLDHALMGIRVQFGLRAALIVFLAATVAAVPPAHDRVGCDVTVGVYAIWSAGSFYVCHRGGLRVVRMIWVTLLADVVALGVLSLLASASEQSWTTDVLVNAFFVIPLLATAQLRPLVVAAVTAPAVAVYLAALIAAQGANSEPAASIALRTGVLAILSAGGWTLSWVQRSRVLTIATLVGDRSQLTRALADVERTARRGLAEELHDGALQYVLAARQELEEARLGGASESFDRIEHALRESAALLRAKVSQLHPAVLEHAGLRRALEDLVNATARGDGPAVTLEASGWDPSRRTAADELIYSAARELLSNVSRHARASRVVLSLREHGEWILLSVSDDGVGIAEGALARRLAEGHVGVASQRARIEAAGGHMTIGPGSGDPDAVGPGTTVEVRLPREPGASNGTDAPDGGEAHHRPELHLRRAE